MQDSIPKHIDVVDILKNDPKYTAKFAALEAYITEEFKKKHTKIYDDMIAAFTSFNEKIIAKMHELAQTTLPHIESKSDDFPIDPTYKPTALDKDFLIGQLYYYLHWISCRNNITDKAEQEFSAVLNRALELVDPDKYPCQQSTEPAKEVNIPVDELCEGLSCAGSGERMMKCVYMYVTALAHTYHAPKLTLDFGCDTPTMIPILFRLIPQDIRELTIKCSISNTEQLCHFVVGLREYLSCNNPLVTLEMNAGAHLYAGKYGPLFTPGEEDNKYLDYLAERLINNAKFITLTGNLLNSAALKYENVKLKAENTALKSERAKLIAERTELQYVNARQKAQLAAQAQREPAIPQTTETQLPRPT